MSASKLLALVRVRFHSPKPFALMPQEGRRVDDLDGWTHIGWKLLESSFDARGENGLFRLTLYVAPGGQQSALLYVANHAISDQRSAQIVPLFFSALLIHQHDLILHSRLIFKSK